jgi:phage terminase large subunit
MIIPLSSRISLRPQQKDLLRAFFINGYRYFIRVAHRRFGKDLEAFTLCWCAAIQTPGIYIYLLPTIGQSRHVIWETIGEDGTKLLDRIPPQFVVKRNESEQKIVFRNGSIIYVTGSDNYKRLIGMNAKGLVYSEYQDSLPESYDALRPMITRNQGWTLFNGTPRAYNHFGDLFHEMKTNPSWYVTNLTCEDTVDNDGNRIITPEMIAQERANGMPEELIQQEYFGSWAAAIRGAYYSEQLTDARRESRIGHFPLDPLIPVHTAWDLGVDDETAIWFIQVIHGKIIVFDYVEASGKGMEYFVQLLKDKQTQYNCRYGTHFVPHDIEVREWGAGKSRRSQAQELGLILKTVPAPAAKIEGIQCVRYLFKRLHFHEHACRLGLKRLTEYRTVYNEKLESYSVKPRHDRATHGADALQTFALGWMRAFDQEGYANQIKYANLYTKEATNLRG